MANGLGKDNIVHYESSRCYRVTRSVMAVEVHALVHEIDHGYVVCKTLDELMGRRIENEAFVDSRTFFNTIATNNTTAERILQIDLCTLMKSYKKGELKKVAWIPGKQNPADVLTKEILSQTTAMWKLMTTNSMNVEPIGRASKEHAPGQDTSRKSSIC